VQAAVRGVTIRAAVAADAAALHALLAAAYMPFRARFVPSASRLEPAEIAARAADWLVLEAGDDVVGCVLSEREDDFWTFSYLAVRPDRQRRGYGGALVEAAAAQARAAGRRAVRIAVRRELAENVRFFRRRGFRFEGELTAGGAHDIYRLDLED
jgi:ribosomal protein S18 acetylase RimI-like enzyme